MKFPKVTRWQIVLGVSIILLAALLRFSNLDSMPVFADEAIYVRWAQVMRAEPTLRFLPLSDGKQPLYMWIVIPFQKLISDPVVAGRVVSVLSGIGTLLGVGVLSLILFRSINVALFAGFLYAVSPFAVFYDRLALVDSMLSMFGIWFVIFSLLTVIYKRLDLAMIAGFILGGAFLTKSTALFFVILLPSTLLLYKFPTKESSRTKDLLGVTLRFVATLFIGFGFYNILRLGPSFQQIAIRNQDYVNPLNWILQSPLDPFKPFFHRNIQYYLILGNFVAVTLFLIGITNIKRYWKSTLLVIIWFIVPILIVSEYSKTMTARYIFYSVPYFMTVAGSSYLVLKGKLRSVFIILTCGFIVTALYQNYQNIYDLENAKLPRSERSGFLEEWTSGTGIKDSADYIRSQYNLNPSQKIVVGTEGYFGTLPDAMQAYLSDLPEITVIGVGLNFDEVPSSLMESRQYGNETYFVTNQSRLKLDPANSDLEIVKEYQKAEKPQDVYKYGFYVPGRDKLLLMRLK